MKPSILSSAQILLHWKRACVWESECERERVCVCVWESACVNVRVRECVWKSRKKYFTFRRELKFLCLRELSSLTSTQLFFGKFLSSFPNSLSFCLSHTHSHTLTLSHARTLSLFFSQKLHFLTKSITNWWKCSSGAKCFSHSFPLFDKKCSISFSFGCESFFVKKRCKALNSGYNILLLDN